jgi:PKD repeat protein
MGKIVPSRLRVPSIAAAAALVLSSFLVTTPAFADSSPADPTNPATPTTVTADALATPQINGVVWTQKIVGNTVYAGGNFTTAQPSGSAAGVNTVTRTDILAYDVTTGVLINSFAPTLNGQVKSIAISPDGTRLYVGGSFTQVNGATQNRVVALNPSTGATLSGFNPSPNGTVNAIATLGSTVYLGGSFTSLGSTVRQKAAAVTASSAAILPWAPVAAGGDVSSFAIAPDSSKVILGGSFTSLNGSSDPGYGLGAVDPSTAALLPWAINDQVRDGGPNAGITSLASDADGLYGSGYVFGDGGNLEGSFRADWATGTMIWVEDCHGDSYSVATTANALYLAGHPHYCGNIGGFPQTSPNWTFHRALAFGKTPTGTITPDPYGYFNWAGNPHPSLLNWFPDFNTGTFTGQNQGPWSVATNSQYVVYGGEFTTVNGTRQQGLTRFAVSSIAPNKQGPMVTGNKFIPNVVSLSSGTARVSWTANWDRDNTHLTYAVYRNGGATPVYTTAADSTSWNLPALGFTDTGLTPGATYTYRVSATDPFGNTVKGDSASVTITTATPSTYAKSVLSQGALDYWRLDEPSGTAVYDWAGYSDQVAGTGVTRGTPGATGDNDAASTFSGDSTGLSATQSAIDGPQTFSVEAWFKTTSTSGGKIVGFGNANTGTSTSYDRHLYMEPNGTLDFGVYNGNTSILSSPTPLNDGTWHQAIGTLSPSGMQLYIDGVRVATRTDATSAQVYQGYWRIGGDSTWNGAQYFGGSIDDVSVYPSALTAQQVDAQWVAAGNKTKLASAPTDTYGSRVFTDSPSLYWRLGDAAGSTTAADSSLYGADPGIYSGGVTQGVPGALYKVSDTAAQFDGVSGQVSSSQAFNDPEVYSTEAWFKTTTTTGGKIIGFGSSQTGQSGSYDRHVYMQDNGQLVFGTYTGQTNTITTPASYNDGTWHYVVATQSSAGLKLYVDGALIGTNPTTSAQPYTGYWKVGGDTTWGSSSAYFNGTIDEAAVYDRALDAATVAQHYALGSAPVNLPPTASFTASNKDLAASFDASASADSDGTIASYAWDFGDGTTGTGVTPSHTYTAGGTYTVKLTVTDNQGATGVSTSTVTVAPHVNVPPTASFISTATNLAVAYDATASTDPDGTIASYAWDFGDGTTGIGATPSHTYAAGGTYKVVLTVTDNSGATATSTAQVTVAAPHVNQPPTASIAATVSNLTANLDGSKSTDADGTVVSYAWDFGDGTTGSGATVSHTYVSAGTYTVKLTVTDDGGATGTTTTTVSVAPPANVPPTAAFTPTTNALALAVDASASNDPDGSVVSYAWDFGDNAKASGKTATHSYAAAGTYTVTLTVTDNQGATGTTTQSVTVQKAPNVPPTASFALNSTGLAVSVDGTSSSDVDGTVASYAWNFGDGATATGVTATHTYAASGSYTVTLTVTDNDGGTGTSSQTSTVQAPVNQKPTAAFSLTPTNLSVAGDASASSDPDGTVASYAWNFGDGATATGKTASHTYATAGTYTVTVTVTDNQGATGTTSQTVTVTSPAPVPFALDNFGRTVSNGFGTADTGGAWTRSGMAANLAVSSGSGTLTLPTAGSQVGAYLYGVSQTSTDLRAQFSLNKAATGGGTYFSAIGRAVSTNNEYRAQVTLTSTGQANLSLSALQGSATATTLVASKTIPGISVAAGTNLSIRVQVTGTAPTTIRARVWVTGTPEPTTWAATATDSYGPLQVPGGVGVVAYASGTATNAPQVISVQQLTAFTL